jgi:hypothetical protein
MSNQPCRIVRTVIFFPMARYVVILPCRGPSEIAPRLSRRRRPLQWPTGSIKAFDAANYPSTTPCFPTPGEALHESIHLVVVAVLRTSGGTHLAPSEVRAAQNPAFIGIKKFPVIRFEFPDRFGLTHKNSLLPRAGNPHQERADITGQTAPETCSSGLEITEVPVLFPVLGMARGFWKARLSRWP